MGSEQGPVLMIGLDAAEISLIRQWMDEGALPNLRALRERGGFGPLASTAPWLVGSPWPSFYTGTSPAEHGLYHYLVWDPRRMTHERPAPDWLPLRPFWRRVARAGRRVVAVDVPMAYPPEPFPGVEINGWATHEVLGSRSAHPAELMDWVHRNFGQPPLGSEETHLRPADQMLQLRDECLRATERAADLGVALMQRQPWDLFLCGLAATHRAGHQLWDPSHVAGTARPEQARQLRDALKAIYIAGDAAIGRLVAQAGPRATTLVFSLHGMGPNVSRADLLREMLARILADRGNVDAPLVKRRLLDGLRERIPGGWRSQVKRRLPTALQDYLTLYWRSGGTDWAATRAFAAFSDLDGYVRINLRGREAAGVVEPGPEYEALCARIEQGLKSFVDEDSGEPVVDGLARLDDLYPTGRMRHHLPDLMVRWSPQPAASHRRIVSPRFGAIPWPTPGHHPQGRSGNHRPDGFLLAAGPSLQPGALEQGHILDLAPTAYDLLGLPVPPDLQGRSLLPDLVRRHAPA